VRELVSRGHRRIVLLNQRARRHPGPGLPERAYLEELHAAGITPSSFNMPDWDASPEGLVEFLHACYLITPPSAFLIDESYLFQAVKHQLASRGIRCPRDVSLVCTDPDHHFIWCRPSVAHIQWDHRELIRHILRWAKSVREGKERRDQIEVPANLVLGDTIGQANA
jgi:DNA-binding LacI/PurR family transcriptional regulator